MLHVLRPSYVLVCFLFGLVVLFLWKGREGKACPLRTQPLVQATVVKALNATIVFFRIEIRTSLTTRFCCISRRGMGGVWWDSNTRCSMFEEGRSSGKLGAFYFYLEIAMCLSIRAFSSSFSCWNRFSLSTSAVLLSTLVSTRGPTFTHYRLHKAPYFPKVPSWHQHTLERLNSGKLNSMLTVSTLTRSKTEHVDITF